MTIFEEGRMAAKNGLGALDNPYPVNSMAARRWNEGYSMCVQTGRPFKAREQAQKLNERDLKAENERLRAALLKARRFVDILHWQGGYSSTTAVLKQINEALK